MSRLPRRFGRNLITSYLNTATVAVITVVTTPVLVNGLGREGFGIWSLVASFALYLKLLDLGFGKATSKYVAEYDAVSNPSGSRTAVVTTFWLLAIPGLGALVLGALLTVIFPKLFHISSGLETETQILILLVVVDLAVSVPGDTFGSALIGLQRFDLINASLVAVSIAQAVGWVIVLGAGGGLAALGAVTVGISLVGQVVRFLLARRFLPGLAMAPKNIDRSLLKPLAGLSLWFAVIDIALVLLVRIDVVVVGLAVGVAAAGVYAVGQKLVLAVHQLTLPATRMFFPHSSELEARRDVVGLQESLISGTRITLAVAAPICLTMSLLAQPILQAWVGHGFEGAGPVVIFLAAALVITIIPRTGLLMLQGIGRARGPALVITGEAILNVGLSVLLAKQIGLKGVALGTLIAAAVANLGVLLPYVSRAFDLGVGTFIVSLGRAHLLPAIGATSVALVLRHFNPDQIPTAIGACLLTIATYVVLLARTGLTTRERRQLLMQLRTWRTQEVTSSV